MGVKNLSSILKDKGIQTTTSIDKLNGQTIGFDAFNQIFQFLATIRDHSSGGSLTDSQGNVTSHLIGILTRSTSLLQKNIKPVWIFDGESHQLKFEEQEKRRSARDLAQIEYDKAIADGNMERAKLFAKRINKLTPEMIEDSKTLLKLMGIPVVQAPGEGEAQASQMTIDGIINATASQDYDTLMFGSPILIRNLNILGKRNLPNGRTVVVKPEKYELHQVLSTLELTREQFVDMGILMGTDFNDGFYKVGPKTAYKYIKKYGSFEETKKHEEKINSVEIPYETIRDIFLKPDVIKNIDLDLDMEFDYDGIVTFLESRNFTSDRYIRILNKTKRELKKLKSQTSLDDWF